MILFFFYYTLNSGVHVHILQDCYIGIHMQRWFDASIPPSPTLDISPNLIPPQSPYPHYPSPGPPPPNRPYCVIFPSLCPYILVIQHLPMSENMRCLVFCSSVSLLRMMVSNFMFLQRAWTHHFLWLHSIPSCICATFSGNDFKVSLA